jgi:hypothetical protein
MATPHRLRHHAGVGRNLCFTAIKRGRVELFGRDLKDAAIYYRLRKGRERGVRVCTEPHCGCPIPALANGRRRYCEAHGSGAARVRLHRRGAAGFEPIRPRRGIAENK